MRLTKVPTSTPSPEGRGVPAETIRPPDSAGRVALVAMSVVFAGSQFFDYATAQGLSSVEPRGYFAEMNPLLAQIPDPVARLYVGLALKLAIVIFVVWVARLQRRRAIGLAILVVGTLAGLFGVRSNLNPWG